MRELIREDKFDSIVRNLVKDIISVVKYQKQGEFGLPEDLRPEEMVYSFPKLNTEFSVFLDLQVDEEIQLVDVDADYYPEDQMIYLTIKTNPQVGNKVLQELIGELNEILRHELEHIRQYEDDYEFPKETKIPLEYYTQKHELDAQVKGFNRRAKQENKNFEQLVRNWFRNNKNKHKLSSEEIEFVVDKIISNR